jgi:2,4-dienoyl-CoA reductase-like NADH-dependent reductase (Old Yellow Enzyme family)/NADPH-dependent 2,4-dienoyl-CoA reductase/sulfur reductase-like enzyme
MAFVNNFPHVFQPIKLGPVTLKNRIHYTPMVCNLVTTTGEVTAEFVEFLGSQARTGAALITIGATPVNEVNAIDYEGEIYISSDDRIGGLSRLVEEVHRYGAKLSVELCHAGRAAYPPLLKTPYALAPTAIPTSIGVKYIKEMDQKDIDGVIDDYVNCAYRCTRAGFDMVMIHAAHGNLLSQFLSPYTNKRADYYGGSLENRMRFPLEVLQAVREKVGRDFGIEMRVSSDEIVDGGQGLDEVLEFLQSAQKYIDCVQMSQGLIVDPDYSFHTITPYYYHHNHNVKYSEAAKKVLDIPVSVVGSITDMEDVEAIIASGKADYVGMARQLLTDFNTIKHAYGNETQKTRPCLRCLEGCTKFAGKGWPVRCAVNPVVGREYKYKEIAPARTRKKAMVVGGGPAGMMAAQTLLARGHEVVLYEKDVKLGGMLNEICALPFKGDLKRYLDWNDRTTMLSGAKVILGTEATPDIVERENPDVLFLAVGSVPVSLQIPGIEKPNVKHVLDVDNGRAAVGEKVLVCGGGVSGLECALALAMDGKDVTVADIIPSDAFAGEMSFITRNMLLHLLKTHKVKLLGGHKAERFLDDGAEVIDSRLVRKTIEADTIVIAFGMKPNHEIVKNLSGLVLETYAIGDCDVVGNIYSANHAAFNYAVEV